MHRRRDQKDISFLVLRDGTGYLQVVLSGKVVRYLFLLPAHQANVKDQNQTYEALTLTLESTIEVIGTLQTVKEGQQAPGGHELVVDHWKVIGAAPGAEDAFTNRLNEVCPLFTWLPKLQKLISRHSEIGSIYPSRLAASSSTRRDSF